MSNRARGGLLGAAGRWSAIAVGRRSAIAAGVALVVLGALWPREPGRLGENSFGVVPGGQRALFVLLSQLGLPVERSYRSPARLDPAAVVWWVAPHGLCAEDAEEDALRWDAQDWLEAGGTALVFLAAPNRGQLEPAAESAPALPGCARLASFPVPPRTRPTRFAFGSEPSPEPPAEEGGWLDGWWDSDDAPEAPAPDLLERLDGEGLTRARSLPGPLARFEGLGEGDADWTIWASVAGLPFVIERSVGKGRLVLVADAGPLLNRWLDQGDAAPFALDLVRSFGVPRLDERGHGLRLEQSAWLYLATSPALPAFAGLALLGLLRLWQGAALPRRRVEDLDLAAPTLESFVGGLATLYARTRDHTRVAERYRAVTLARLRRQLGLAPDTPERALLDRLRRERRSSEAALALLEPEAAARVRSLAELRKLAHGLDTLAKEICS